MSARNPDSSPLPVELLSLPHSNLYLRRMKDDDDYEDIDDISAPPPIPPKPFSLENHNTRSSNITAADKSSPINRQNYNNRFVNVINHYIYNSKTS